MQTSNATPLYLLRRWDTKNNGSNPESSVDFFYILPSLSQRECFICISLKKCFWMAWFCWFVNIWSQADLPLMQLNYLWVELAHTELIVLHGLSMNSSVQPQPAKLPQICVYCFTLSLRPPVLKSELAHIINS